MNDGSSDMAKTLTEFRPARTAGISLRTLYRYFPTRDALLREGPPKPRARQIARVIAHQL